VRWGNRYVPLNPDVLTTTTWRHAGEPALLPGTIGFLDADGHAEGAVVLGPQALLAMAGLRMDWVAVAIGKGQPLVSNPVGFDVLP
jgi:hypothetical protein